MAKRRPPGAGANGHAATLTPDAPPPDPGERRLLMLPAQTAGIRVTEDTALTLGAVFACLRVISEDIAGLPWRVMERRRGGGADERPDDAADWLLHYQANPETPAFQWRETMLAWALSWGNGYAEIERDGAGRPVWLWQIAPDRVYPSRDGAGRLVYEVRNPGGPDTVLDAADVFHLRGLGFDGLVGYSVIRLAARAIGLGIGTEQAAATLWSNDATPGGILQHPGKLSPTAATNLREGWNRRHQGPANRRQVAVLEEGMTWQQTGLPPEDAQLIEQRQFTPADIARWFRVPPPKIADLSRATFSNIEELAIWYVTDTLMPWVRRLETEANVKLFGRTNRGRVYTKINLNALLRGKVQDRGDFYTKMYDRGIYNANEVRGLEDLNPIGPDGDKRFVPVNMQLLEDAGEEPPPGSAPPPGEAPEPGDAPSAGGAKEQAMSRAVAAFDPVFTDACRRFLRRGRNELERHLPKLSGDERAAWLERMAANQEAYARDQLAAPARGFALAATGGCPEAVTTVVELFARREARNELISRAGGDGLAGTNWEALPGVLAAGLIRQLAAALEVSRVAQPTEEVSGT